MTSKVLSFSVKYSDYDSYFNRRHRVFVMNVCRGERLEVHHKNYKSLGNENSEDVVVLCVNCHKNEHLTKNGAGLK
jgi:5-methylcytosine-specific restriction endonuclease McrA